MSSHIINFLSEMILTYKRRTSYSVNSWAYRNKTTFLKTNLASEKGSVSFSLLHIVWNIWPMGAGGGGGLFAWFFGVPYQSSTKKKDCLDSRLATCH